MTPAPCRVRRIQPEELDPWAGAAGAPDPAIADAVRAMWSAGTSRPEWTFLAEDDRGAAVGRVAIAAEPVAQALPTLEHRVVGLRLAWDDPVVDDVGRVLLDAAVREAVGSAGGTVDARVNAEVHDRPQDRVRVLEAAGFRPFQEKVGVLWEDDGRALPPPDRLRLEPLTLTNEADLRRAMAAAGEGTLDVVDRHYRSLVGPDGWAAEMFGYLTDDDRPSWLLARDPHGVTAGYILLGAFDEPGTATIVHVGVVPAARGRGYGAELLRAANVVARARGFARILSDVDAGNRPMLDAMAAAGHRAGVRPWHIWHLRRVVPPSA